MSLLSAAASTGTFDFAALWAEVGTVMVRYVFPVVVSLGIVKIIQIVSKQIGTFFEPAAPKAVGERKSH